MLKLTEKLKQKTAWEKGDCGTVWKRTLDEQFTRNLTTFLPHECTDQLYGKSCKMRQPLTLNGFYIKIPGNIAALQSFFESPHWSEIFTSQESQEQEFLEKQAKSSFLVNNTNIKKSPWPQRETSGPRTWSLGCTGPRHAAQDMNHRSGMVTSCSEFAIYFSPRFSPGHLCCACHQCCQLQRLSGGWLSTRTEL